MSNKKCYPKKHIIMIFYGVSGSGKSMLLDMMKSTFANVTLHKKDSDRPARKREPKEGTPELRLVKKFGPKKDYLFKYKQYGHWYAVRKDQLNKAFANHEVHLIILGNMNALKKFKTFYPHAITIYVHSDPENIPDRLIKRDTLEFGKRQKRIDDLYRDFLRNNTFFDFIVLNFWDGKNAKKQAENIIKKYLERTGRLFHC